MPIFFQLSKIRDKGREEVQLLATAGCASPENIFPGSLHDRRSSRQRPAENSDFVLSQQGVLVFFLACYLNSSPTSEGLWFGHRVKYRFKRPTLAWPQKASQLSLSRIYHPLPLLSVFSEAGRPNFVAATGFFSHNFLHISPCFVKESQWEKQRLFHTESCESWSFLPFSPPRTQV